MNNKSRQLIAAHHSTAAARCVVVPPSKKGQVVSSSASKGSSSSSSISAPPLSPNTPTYLCSRGYAIEKKHLTSAHLDFIRTALTVKPVVGLPGAANTAVPTFPAYRESNTRIYLPRYFGIHHFGPAQHIVLAPNTPIDVPFVGQLRDYQERVVRTYQEHALDANRSGGLISLPCGRGKTVIGLKILSVMSKKTLIIVHKEFLLNQWVERIEQYLPTARVGRIQGPVFDVQDKDIVIGMLQSLSMKDYAPEQFASFGLMIIDEVHHISSEVFSNSLFKIVPEYTLGLSATMNRKDGTTYVFKLFLGDMIYQETAADVNGQHAVQVRAIEFQTGDAEFNHVETDFRGNPAFSTMLVKLCAFQERSEFVLRVLMDMIYDYPDKQVMVIAHNKSVLKYLHDSIRDRDFEVAGRVLHPTVGYYIGGMKEAALKATESKQVVIATYAMAAEALDIKTLSGLIMVTPKTDIEQTVGRILRSKHDLPIVVDIVDSHEPFQRQWAKRKTFYKKQGYSVYYSTSALYKKSDPSVDLTEAVWEPTPAQVARGITFSRPVWKLLVRGAHDKASSRKASSCASAAAANPAHASSVQESNSDMDDADDDDDDDADADDDVGDDATDSTTTEATDLADLVVQGNEEGVGGGGGEERRKEAAEDSTKKRKRVLSSAKAAPSASSKSCQMMLRFFGNPSGDSTSPNQDTQ